MQSPNVLRCNDENLAGALGNVIGNVPEHAPLDDVQVHTARRSNFKDGHAISLYHLDITPPTLQITTDPIGSGTGIAGVRVAAGCFLLAAVPLTPASPFSTIWTTICILTASLLITWGAESAQFFVAQGFALAILALMQTLPEFAVEAVRFCLQI